MAITTIQIDAKTRERLSRLKTGPRETYDEILQKFLSLIPEGDEEGHYTDRFRAGVLESMMQAAVGDVIPLGEAKKRLGL
ncbi:MAG: hypothetical protein HY556_06830 [Euryarchaeota archaeon]|nr:hypothetical protein [Euryarchaeota archaeon]